VAMPPVQRAEPPAGPVRPPAAQEPRKREGADDQPRRDIGRRDRPNAQ
jgi:hypothetical protein